MVNRALSTSRLPIHSSSLIAGIPHRILELRSNISHTSHAAKDRYQLLFSGLRNVSILGILAVCALLASACAGADVNVTRTTETPPRAAISTPSPEKQGPNPGLGRDSAPSIGMGEAVVSTFNILYPQYHFYAVQFEEGTTYTVDVLDTLGRSSVYITNDAVEDLVKNTGPGGGLSSSIEWTAPNSEIYYVKIIGDFDNSYTLTVTAGGTVRAQTPVSTPASNPTQTTMPGVSPTSSPSGTALKFVSLSAGGNHTCGVTTSGTAYCWGWDFYGQLGNGSATDDQLRPAAVSGGLAFASVSAGSEHTCGVTATGAAYCWGIGDGGRLGNGSTGDQRVPVAVSGGLVFESVSAGINHTCGVTATGAAYCWGKGFSGQIGNNAYDDRSTPTAVSGGLTFASVSAGNGHACGITTSGAVNCWGEFHIPRSTSPAPVSAGISLASINEYHNHTCGVETSGAAYCWGLNWGGQLGIGTEEPQGKPVPVLGGLTFASVSAGELHTCGITISGDAYCWGLGDERIGSDLIDEQTMPVQTRPVAVSGGLNFESVSASRFHTCGVTISGAGYCWGSGNSGRLGDGLEKDQNTPVAVVSPADG